VRRRPLPFSFLLPPLPEPTLILDFTRPTPYALPKPPIPEFRRPLDLDPRTGIRLSEVG